MPLVTKRTRRQRKSSHARRSFLAALRAGAKDIQAKEFEFLGTLDLIAGEDDAAEPTLVLDANSGVPMDLAGFEHPVIVDMKGASFDKKKTPVLADHDIGKRVGHTTAQTIIPAGAKQSIKGKSYAGPRIVATAVRSSEMEIAKGIVKDAKGGFPFQVSIGARIKKGYILEEGDSAEVNGKVWNGPLIVATRSVIRELSITVLGADNDTSAVVAARAKENDMDFEQWLDEEYNLKASDLGEDSLKKFKAKFEALEPEADPPPKKKVTKKIKAKARKKILAGGDPDDDDDDDDSPPSRKKKFLRADDADDDNDDDVDVITDRINAGIADNQTRIEAIGEVAEEFSQLKDYEFEVGKKKLNLRQLKAHAIKARWTPEQFELQCRRADLPDIGSGFNPGIQTADKSIDAKALEVSLLRHYGAPDNEENKLNKKKFGLDALYDTKTLEAADKKQYQIHGSFKQLLRIQVQSMGGYAGHLDDSSLLAAAHRAWTKVQDIRADGVFSNISVTNILENVMHKAAYQAFAAVESVWPFITGRRPLNDFKIHSLYRLDPNGHFRKVAADGQLKHVSMTDTKKTIQAETFGAMIAIDRKTQRNDDLGLILDKARSIGNLGALRIEEAIFVLLLSNPGSFFASGNNNLITGGGTALSVASLQTAQQKFRDQLINGKPISVSPSILLVGTNQEVLSNQLYNQTQMWITTTADTPKFANNPFAGRFRPYQSGYLNNTSITDQDGLTLSGQTTTQWYLFAPPTAPQGSALVIGFLDGRETPYFDEAATEFSIPGGIQMRSYFDFGVAMHITQMALKSAGA